MTPEELISSGIIELYCLGLASHEENLLVESLLQQDDMVKEEVAAVSDALANYALAASVNAPAHLLKEKIFSFIQSGSENMRQDFPPELNENSTTDEWLRYLETKNIMAPEDAEAVHSIELPGTEDYFTYVVFARPGGMVEEEFHNSHDECLLICTGECEMIIDGKKSHYKAGDLITIQPGIRHSAMITGTEKMIVIGQRRAA